MAIPKSELAEFRHCSHAGSASQLASNALVAHGRFRQSSTISRSDCVAEILRPFVEKPKDLIGQEITSPPRAYFDPPVIDHMLDAITELAAELWTCRDRLYVLERVAHDQNLTQAIEQWVPSADELAERAALREAFTSRIFGSFLRNVPAALAPQTSE
jgi:hypothetical protein